MIRKQLNQSVVFVIAVFTALLGTAIVSRFFWKNLAIYEFIKDFLLSLLLLGEHTWRIAFKEDRFFLVSLRELWHEIIEAKTSILIYIDLQHPNEAAYIEAYRNLSRAIDLVRGVYKNIDEDNLNIGKFSFRPLHDVRESLSSISSANITKDEKDRHRELIKRAWNALRFSFLKEFNRPFAAHPIVEVNAYDPRRLRQLEARANKAKSMGQGIN